MPSQSAWCNMVVLVRKKDIWPAFLHRLLPPQWMHKKGLLPPTLDKGGFGEFSRCWTFCLLGPQIGVLADENGGGIEAVTTYTVGNLGFFECHCMPFRLCNVPATLQRPMQNCLVGLNLIYCLIYLDDLIMFLQTAEEHLHRLCIAFD